MRGLSLTFENIVSVPAVLTLVCFLFSIYALRLELKDCNSLCLSQHPPVHPAVVPAEPAFGGGWPTCHGSWDRRLCQG